MNSTTAATVIAAGLALATLAAGGLALWLYARSKTVGGLPEQRPTTPPRGTPTPTPRADDDLVVSTTAESEPTAREPEPIERPSTRSSASTQATAPPRPRERAGPSSGFFGSGSYVETHEHDVTPLAPLPPGNQTELDLSGDSRRAAPRSADTVQPVNRKRRYTIHEGQPIELKMGDAPPGAVLRPSRDSVEFEEIERAGDRIRFALHGPAGDVNVILVQEGGKRDKVIRNWKFELREAAA